MLGVEPTVWRRFDPFANVKLSQLHSFIQSAMGGKLCHLFSYKGDHDYRISSELRLCDVCHAGDALIYTYDFGDDWPRRVTIENTVVKPTGAYPRVVAGKYACPPEDCGGPWGYEDMLRVLPADDELVEWLGGPFDPRVFDLDEARERLAEYVEVSMPKPQPVAG